MVAQSAKLRAAKSAGQIHGTAAHGAKPRASRNRHAKTRPANHLRWCNTAIVPPPATYPHPPGAYVLEPSLVVPGIPDVDHRQIPSLVAQKLFLDALLSGRQALLRAAEERDAQAEAAQSARLVEQDSRNAEEAHRRAEEVEYYARSLEEKRKAEESHHQDLEQEKERRRIEQEQEESRKREHCVYERREQERHKREAFVGPGRGASKEKWAALRDNAVRWDTSASAISRGPFLRTSGASRVSLMSKFCPLCAIAARASCGSRGRVGQIRPLGDAALAYG